MKRLFQNRTEAGRMLAAELIRYAGQADVLVLGLPRGGVTVAFEVAQKLKAPLDVLVVRKLGVPGQEELAMGAIAAGDVKVLDETIVRYLQIPEIIVEAVVAAEMMELERREKAYHSRGARCEIGGKTVILIDDGVATGATLRAAIQVVKKQSPARLIAAVPFASPWARDEFKGRVDEMVVLNSTDAFESVGQAYENFTQVTDAEVTRLMEIANDSRIRPNGTDPCPVED
jgi:putative phosphoribosyl transferase